MASPPTPGRIAITVKAMGVVSDHLVRRSRVGTVLQLDQATGDFVLPPVRPAKVLLVTAGSGITPVMGMLRNTDLPDAVLVHCAPTAADVIFGAELRALAAARKLRLVEWHTDTAGFLTPQALAAAVPDLAERETWACGPVGLLDTLEAHLPGPVHTERFRPAVVVAGAGGTVTFATQHKTVAAGGGTPLLDAGARAGVRMPARCRMGVGVGGVGPRRPGRRIDGAPVRHGRRRRLHPRPVTPTVIPTGGRP